MNPVLAKVLQEKWLPRILAWLAALLTAAAVTGLTRFPIVETVLEMVLNTDLTPELIFVWSASVLVFVMEWVKTKLRWKLGQTILGNLWPDSSARKRTFDRMLELRRLDKSALTPPPVKELDPVDDFFTNFVEHRPGAGLGEPLAR